MNEQAASWLEAAGDDLGAAQKLVDSYTGLSLFHAYQAAEKGLKAPEIHRTGGFTKTHDLVRLYRALDVPTEFQTLLKELNPAYTATRYPDVNDLELPDPGHQLERVRDLLIWIRTHSTA